MAFYERRPQKRPPLCYTRAKARLLFLRLVGGTSFLDFLQQMLLRIIEQQALVVRKVGFAPEILDKPRGKVIRGQFGCKQHHLLTVPNGFVKEGKGVCQRAVGLVGGIRTRLHIGLKFLLEVVECAS